MDIGEGEVMISLTLYYLQLEALIIL